MFLFDELMYGIVTSFKRGLRRRFLLDTGMKVSSFLAIFSYLLRLLFRCILIKKIIIYY